MSDSADRSDDVGPFGEEAAKLFGAFSVWAQEHAGDTGDGLSGLAAQAAEAAHDLNDHIATGSAECTACPLCRTIHAVRQLSPEVKAHLTTAAASLAQAAAAIMATTEPRESESASVEHIDLDVAWPDEPADQA